MNLRKAMTTNDHLVADQNVREKDILLAGNLPRLGDEVCQSCPHLIPRISGD